MFALFRLEYHNNLERLGYYVRDNDIYIFMGYTLIEAQANYKEYKERRKKHENTIN